MLKKLPVGIYTLKKIIEENYLYIDKTDIALNLINNNEYVFLSRPRRFGKSLFLDTLSEIFKGNKEFFKDLYIYDKYDFKKHPVIKISFSGGIYNKEDLNENLLHIMKVNQEKLGISCENLTNANICFSELIQKANKKYNEKVVVLIDEYDKPILDNIDKSENAQEIRNGLRDFYTRIKDNDEYLKFAFLTGVSKFTKTSIFSGLNNITDITLNERYGNICGYTQKDIETSFLPYLKSVDLEKLKTWYNGYNFLKDKVYNPYNILLFIQNDKKYRNYWFESGTPSFLIKLIQKNRYFLPELSNLKVGEDLLNSFDVENIKLETLLFQSGYLTIDSISEIFERAVYKLKYPNFEVKTSLNDYIFRYLSDKVITDFQESFHETISTDNIRNFEKEIFTLFASIPVDNYRKNNVANYEGYYASVLYAYFAGMGVNFIAEDVTNKGYIDLTLFFEDRAYILEFKVTKGTPRTNPALKQIKEKKYYEKYINKYNKVYNIGIVFSKKKRNIAKFNYETVK